MKSRDERKAEFERREVERKAKYRERMDAIRAKGAAQKEASPVLAPHKGPTLGGILFPPLGAYQVVRSTVDQFKEMNAMSPAERAEYMRRNPGFGSGGPM